MPGVRAVLTHGPIWAMARAVTIGGGKFFEPGSLLCYFMILLLMHMIQFSRILYRLNVVKFAEFVLL